MKKAIAILERSKSENDATDLTSVLADLQNSIQADMNVNGISTPDRVYIFVVIEEDQLAGGLGTELT